MVRFVFCIFLTLATAAAAQTDAGLARGWFVSGTTAAAYDVNVLEPGACGARAVRVAAKTPKSQGAVGVLQTFRADDYRGARLRYSAVVDAKEMTGWGGLFFRVDGAERKTLSFDDMRSRPVRGTWKCARVSVVADVPEEAEFIALGIGFEGGGALELSDVAVERVAAPLTTGVDQSDGRVGDVWFTDSTMGSNGGAGYRAMLKRRAPGVWSNEQGDAEGRLEGPQVLARLFTTTAGPTPLSLTGEFTLTSTDTALTIVGQWGTAMQKYPVTITLTPTELDMKWGFYERHLRAEPSAQLRAGCRYYGQSASVSTYSDGLEVCGGVLSRTPPPVQTVLSFLMHGFRRFGTGLPMPIAPVAPTVPDPSRFPHR